MDYDKIIANLMEQRLSVAIAMGELNPEVSVDTQTFLYLREVHAHIDAAIAKLKKLKV